MIHDGAREMTDGVVRLREVRPEDARDLYRWRMHPESRLMFRTVESVPYEFHAAYLGRYFQADNTDRWFVIEAAGVPVGTIVLYGLSPEGREAEWGRLVVAPEQRGRGYAKRALRLLIEHARGIGVRALRCEVLAANAVAERLYREAGFVQTGSEEVGGRRFVKLVLDVDGVP